MSSSTPIKPTPPLVRLQVNLRPLRDRLLNHQVYHQLETLKHVRIFMEHHVFAVWDFMSLLKSLQRHLTGVTLPWLPEGNRLDRRLINEIVLEEESDENMEGGYTSHFELYCAAMQQCAADTSKIDQFLSRLRQKQAVPAALESANVPEAAQAFVRTTWGIVESGSVHQIAAAFTLGREELIPDMFRSLLADLHKQFSDQLTLLRYYLERHVQLDEERHTPMALRMLSDLCGDDDGKWQEAVQTAQLTLNARIDLWDAVVDQVLAAKTGP